MYIAVAKAVGALLVVTGALLLLFAISLLVGVLKVSGPFKIHQIWKPPHPQEYIVVHQCFCFRMNIRLRTES
jgi:hypothetical protein